MSKLTTVTAAEEWAQRQADAFGYEWGVLPSGEVIPYYVTADGHSPKPPIPHDSWEWWHWKDTHPEWMECYLIFEPETEDI